MLVQRLITAIILSLVIVVGILYLPPVGFKGLSLLIVALAVWEFSHLFSGWNFQARLMFLLMFLAVALLAHSVSAAPILIFGVLIWLVSPYMLWQYVKEEHNYFRGIVWQWLLGLLIFVPCWIGLVVIKEKFGAGFLLYLVAIICATDIGAYFAGRFFGHRLLAPKISPKKTLEGVYGGIASALLVAVGGVLWLKFNAANSGEIMVNFTGLRTISFLLLTTIACLWSIIGDLFESMLKRQAGVKDSGILLPGHGGVYDRIDSITAAVPIFALGLLLI